MKFVQLKFGDNVINMFYAMFKSKVANFLLSMDNTFIFTDISEPELVVDKIVYTQNGETTSSDITDFLDLLLVIFDKKFLKSEKELFIDMFNGLININDYGFEIVNGIQAQQYLLKSSLCSEAKSKYSSLQQSSSVTPEKRRFITNNPTQISVLILKDSKDSDKIKGRALIFNNVEISRAEDKKIVNVMDRIQTTNNGNVYLFKLYAKLNNCVHRKSNKTDSDQNPPKMVYQGKPLMGRYRFKLKVENFVGENPSSLMRDSAPQYKIIKSIHTF